MNFSIAYDIIRVTEKAAIYSSLWRGKGNKNAADEGATEAMREMLNSMPVKATVVIGEGERDEAPMLYIGETLGTGGEELDIAVDPLDGTNLCAKNRENSIAVIALSDRGSFLHAPDMYMLKLGVGKEAKGAIDLNKSFTENLQNIAKAMGKEPKDLRIVMLDRERHDGFMKEAYDLGASIRLITDGDVAPMVECCLEEGELDVLFGIGAAAEGALGASIAKCLGGDFQGKLQPRNDSEIARCKEMGIEDPSKVFKLDDMVKSDDVIFCMTGVTPGRLVDGVKRKDGKVYTETLLLNSQDQSVRYMKTEQKEA